MKAIKNIIASAILVACLTFILYSLGMMIESFYKEMATSSIDCLTYAPVCVMKE